MHHKGQVFFPDLLIAVLVFMVSLGLFFVMTDVVFTKSDLTTKRTVSDEVIHATLNVLVADTGVPYNWENKELSDVNLFGLATENNVISENKITALINYLDSNYVFVKEKMGLGKYDFKLRLMESDGVEIMSSDKDLSNHKLVLIYDRVVLYKNNLSIVRGMIGLEK